MKDYFSRINPTVKGIALAFMATLGMANVYVFSKAALLEVSYFQFQLYWFGFAIIWILPFLFITGIIKKIPKLSRSSRITLNRVCTVLCPAIYRSFPNNDHPYLGKNEE